MRLARGNPMEGRGDPRVRKDMVAETYDGPSGGKGPRVFDVIGEELLRPRVEGRNEGPREADFRHGYGGVRSFDKSWPKSGSESFDG